MGERRKRIRGAGGDSWKGTIKSPGKVQDGHWGGKSGDKGRGRM